MVQQIEAMNSPHLIDQHPLNKYLKTDPPELLQKYSSDKTGLGFDKSNNSFQDYSTYSLTTGPRFYNNLRKLLIQK